MSTANYYNSFVFDSSLSLSDLISEGQFKKKNEGQITKPLYRYRIVYI